MVPHEHPEPPRLLLPNRSFLSYLGTQGLGAFNDNVFKQVVLLLSVGVAAGGVEMLAIVQFAFALPFVLFSGFAGDVADRWSKGRLMTICKGLEVVVMLAGLVAFASLARGASSAGASGLWPLVVVTFFMGTQSAFFGPPKYGGIPELVRGHDLSMAAGYTQMTSFLAIILGVAVAGVLKEKCGAVLWIPGAVCVAIAVVGTLISLGIARVPASAPDLRLGMRSFLSVFPTISRIFRTDALLRDVLLVYSWFWLVGGVCLTAINAYGKQRLGLGDGATSALVATLSIGIAVGSVVSGRCSRGRVRLDLSMPGLLAMVVCLVALPWIPVAGPGLAAADVSTSSRVLAFALLTLLGAAAGFFSVPLFAFVQERPPADQKGQVFAAANFLNWIFILGSAAVFGLGMKVFHGRAEWVMAAVGLLTLGLGTPLLRGAIRRQ